MCLLGTLLMDAQVSHVIAMINTQFHKDTIPELTLLLTVNNPKDWSFDFT